MMILRQRHTVMHTEYSIIISTYNEAGTIGAAVKACLPGSGGPGRCLRALKHSGPLSKD